MGKSENYVELKWIMLLLDSKISCLAQAKVEEGLWHDKQLENVWSRLRDYTHYKSDV